MRKALIIGSEGQDGTLLKQLLVSKHYEVWGLGKNEGNCLNGLAGYFSFDLEKDDFTILTNFIVSKKPDEIYYVAAFHHSSQEDSDTDFEFIEKSVKVNQIGFIRILELCKYHHPSCRIFYASSSLIFSGTDQPFQNEKTTPEPRCVYSVTKCAAMEAAKYYRGVYNFFISVGIMYNHESIYRKDYFLSKKIINETKQLLVKNIESIEIGNLSAITDWGYALDYVEAMWHILQLQKPDTFIISSGKGHKVQDWFEVLFNYLNMEWKQYVKEDISLIQRKKPVLIGDNKKLLSTGWIPKVGFEEMVIRMYNNII
ncbi:MAG: GDP-mannose 4,6-dehydratase [Bacteroidetes bacterium]|nr:GDP-mannose 4,6-dehydratase [Bacteroidota bacterium]